MRILFAALALPDPPTTGHRLRNWALVRALALEGHDVTLITFVESGEQIAANSPLWKLCRRIEAIPAPRPFSFPGGGYLGRALALCSGAPYGAWRFRSTAMQRAIRQALASPCDLILCDGIYNLPNIPRAGAPPILLNKDDIASLIFERYLAFERNPLRRLYARCETARLRQWEQRSCRQVSRLMACSEYDRELLEQMAGGVPIFVVPNAVDTNVYQPAPEQNTSTVLFQGGMDWYPNQDAVAFFASSILPELRALTTGFRFRVAGRGPSESFRMRFARDPEVEFSGAIPDIRSEIARAAVCVVPLRIGSGTRLKILEAAAMGKAIVSTGVGAEGLDFVDGEEILLAESPLDFAKAVAGLLADAGRRRQLGQAARRRVEQRYSLTVLPGALRQALSGFGAPARAVAGPDLETAVGVAR